jgi:uncharacterized protein YgiM (DUF1202 family)
MKRVLALLMILMLALPCTAALAASETVYAGKNQVQVYAARSSAARKIGKLSYGESVVCTNYKSFSNGWAKIKNANGKVGYCKMNQLTDDNPNDLSFNLKAKSKAKMYAKPAASSRMLARFSGNAKVKVVALTPDGEWFRVKYSGNYGYVQADQLTGGRQAWFTGRNIAVTDGYGNGENLLSYGEKVRVLDDSKKTVLVRYDGKVGYCNCGSDAFAEKDPCTLSEKRYSIAEGACIYSEAAANKSYRIFTLAVGRGITVLGECENFCRVEYKGKYGYMLKNCLLEEKPEGDVTVVAQQDDLKIYKGKLNSSAVVETVNKGDELTILEIKNARAKVVASTGATGWTFLSQLKVK